MLAGEGGGLAMDEVEDILGTAEVSQDAEMRFAVLAEGLDEAVERVRPPDLAQ